MNHFTLSRRAVALAVCVLGVLVALTGCSKKLTGVDSGYKTLEGSPNADSRLMAWTDNPSFDVVFADLGTPGPDPDPDIHQDTLFAITPYYRTGTGTVHAMVVDRTAASGFQFFRRANNGGLQQITDYTIPATSKWLSSGWESYYLDDNAPSDYSPPTYQARGLLNGKVTTLSPLTNTVAQSATRPAMTMRAQIIYRQADSTYTVNALNTIPAGAGVWIDIYQWTNSATLLEHRNAGLPNPVMTGSVRHQLVAYYPPAAAAGIRSGAFSPANAANDGADVFTYSKLTVGQTYYIRLTAVDANGNVLAWMRGDYFFHQLVGFYEYIPAGATYIKLPNG